MSNAEEIAADFGKVDELLRHLLLHYWQPVLLSKASAQPSWQTTYAQPPR